MPTNRKIWQGYFHKDGFPAWPCPTCSVGSLRLDEKTFSYFKSAETRRLMENRDFNPSDVTGVFYCLLQCDNRECREPVACCGDYGVDQELNEEFNGPEWVNLYAPGYFIPALHVFPIPSKCPKAVKDELTKAFAVHWSDPWSAANRIRASVEALMDSKGIRRTCLTKRRKRRRLTLAERIKLFGVSTSTNGLVSVLSAVRWIGNAGSHTSRMTAADVFDGFDMMEHALKRLYDKSEAEILRLGKRINRRKGPVSRRK